MNEDREDEAAQGSSSSIASSDDHRSSKPMCKYGTQCYRKNPLHFQEYAHPGDHALQGDSDLEQPVAKKKKLDEDTTAPHAHSITLSSNRKDDSTTLTGLPNPPLFYLTRVRGIRDCYNGPGMAIGIRDILSPSMGDLVASAQFNYMFDIPWLMQQYPKGKSATPLLIVHGDQREALIRLKKEAEPYPNIKLFQAKLEIMFGTHHSKMMLLAYKEGMRVVIHTANLIQKDWDQKTQGVWMSAVFPKMGASSQSSGQDTNFKQGLLAYLDAYGGSALNEWKQRVREHDMSAARVHLIASVPGAHTGANMHKWGHLKLRKVLSECGPLQVDVDESWPVVGQFSSVGSLGPSSHQWLCSEWLLSLSTARKSSGLLTPHKYPNLQLVFPTVENVRNSLEGYSGRKLFTHNLSLCTCWRFHINAICGLFRPLITGGSIPYASQTAQKQPYLNGYLCQWKADGTGRSRAAPHIKTYMRVSPDCSQLAWFLVTSANLSKAAWGAFEKKGTQLKIRSYEIGVLFLPSEQGDSSSVTLAVAGQAACKGMQIQVPFDLPLTGYGKDDKPWIWNAKYSKIDCNGNTWAPC